MFVFALFFTFGGITSLDDVVIPASSSATFDVFLLALFVLAGGITIARVVANLHASAGSSARI